ncbi:MULTISPECIES: PRTRC system protein B [unclassified Thioalkalivibrio]|uniref:PRTRC system protein B n=1 Tax=unclassified Thioalkalivibrio TaxID=2621013 RepID=UPI000362A063|nr:MULTISPECIES: PRTRC system protein B [unclassified Thioalkalivibrio]
MALTPTSAILFHEESGQHPATAGLQEHGIQLGYSFGSPSVRGLATVHSVYTSEGAPPALGAGRALSREDARDFLRALAGEPDEPFDTLEDFLDGSVLYSTSRLRVWFVPRRKRTMYIRRSASSEDLRLNVFWPSLVFAANSAGQLYLAATAGVARPTPQTRLFHPPLMNIYERGEICRGSIRTPSHPVSSYAMKEWEEAVFQTWFTHVNHDATFASRDSVNTAEHIQRWRSLEQAGRSPRVSEMAEMGCTLAPWVRFVGERS